MASYQPTGTIVVRHDGPGTYILEARGHVFNSRGEMVEGPISPGTRMLSVACAGLTLNACEATGPDAASAPPPNSGQAGIYRVPTSGADLERLPNPGMLMTRSSTASVH